jgi:hypothetical protein
MTKSVREHFAHRADKQFATICQALFNVSDPLFWRPRYVGSFQAGPTSVRARKVRLSSSAKSAQRRTIYRAFRLMGGARR